MSEMDRSGSHYELEGRYDALRAPELERQLQALLEAGATDLTLDMARVTYLSSSCLRVLLMAHRRAVEAGGRLVLVNIPERILRLLRMAGLDRVFFLCP